MDTSDPDIRFDSAGVCNHCTDYLDKLKRLRATGKAGPDHLPAIISRIRKSGRGKRYDALLGISGGADSCYLALKLKSMGLRVLLTHLDNGWNSHQANQNILKVAKHTGFDYESFVLDWEEFKDIQLAFLRASVVEAETPTDMALVGALHRAASFHGIKYIISASNEASEGILPPLWHYDAKDMKYFKYIQKTFGTKKIRNFPTFGIEQEFYYKFVRGVKINYLMNYLDYDKSQAVIFLKETIGWEEPTGKHHESLFTKFVQSYLLPVKFGIDYRRATLSTLICSGQATRSAALESLKTPPYDISQIHREIEYVARKLGVSLPEMEEIISRPGKYYFEYPNNRLLLGRAYSFYRRFFA